MSDKFEGKGIYYLSTIRGIENPDRDDEERLYYGFVARIPADKFPDEVPEFLDKQMEELMEMIGNLPDDVEVGDTFERYDIWEHDTKDVLTMWRVPIRKKGTIQKVDTDLGSDLAM